jgi:flagellar operon protein
MASGLNFNNIQSVIPNVRPEGAGGNSPKRTDQNSAPNFADTLQGLQPATAKAPLQAPSSLKFSNHAVERMRSRGIAFSPDKLESIKEAVSKAATKGAKNTLLLTDDSALIVSVKDNTVVTVMGKNAMKENVFTNIDSTVLV